MVLIKGARKEALVPPWTHQDAILYHGTTLGNAENILSDGVNLDLAKPLADFGRGFYTTTDLRQASTLARRRAKTKSELPSVVLFEIDRTALGKVSSLTFVLGLPTSLDYWSLVRYCRLTHGYVPVGNAHSFDVVYGPVARDWNLLKLHQHFDQVSFHSKVALNLLNIPFRRRIISLWTP